MVLIRRLQAVSLTQKRYYRCSPLHSAPGVSQTIANSHNEQCEMASDYDWTNWACGISEADSFPPYNSGIALSLWKTCCLFQELQQSRKDHLEKPKRGQSAERGELSLRLLQTLKIQRSGGILVGVESCTLLMANLMRIITGRNLWRSIKHHMNGSAKLQQWEREGKCWGESF